ncbi:MAG: ornithine carbamoyltransferase [Euryarchaeota archaeon]|nr:ornithine carbamoyltransferase [Euryarchaeota archaeon]
MSRRPKRLARKLDPGAQAFLDSTPEDAHLAVDDVLGSLAHVEGLRHAGILTGQEADRLAEALRHIYHEAIEGTFRLDPAHEDVHMNVEVRLTRELGDLGKRLHTGRSRNDQVALDLRLFGRRWSLAFAKALHDLVASLLALAKKNAGTVLPGYTHLQVAQPVDLAFHLQAHAERFQRDLERLRDAYGRILVSPLGAGALAGTRHPIEPAHTAAALGFRRPFRNAMDAVSDRDFVTELLFVATLALRRHRGRKEPQPRLQPRPPGPEARLHRDLPTGGPPRRATCARLARRVLQRGADRRGRRAWVRGRDGPRRLPRRARRPVPRRPRRRGDRRPPRRREGRPLARSARRGAAPPPSEDRPRHPPPPRRPSEHLRQEDARRHPTGRRHRLTQRPPQGPPGDVAVLRGRIRPRASCHPGPVGRASQGESVKTVAIAKTKPKRDFLSIVDIEDRLPQLLETAHRFKSQLRGPKMLEAARGRNLGLIFEKPSTRTRVSFEVGFRKLGGHVTILGKNDIQLGRGESVEDTARVLSRYVDAIAYRAFDADNVRELAKHASIPVINALDDEEHPCQILADWLTVKEHFGKTAGLEFAYVGDGDNNTAHSYLLGAPVAAMNVRILAPKEYQPGAAWVERAKKLADAHGTTVTVAELSDKALKGVDVVATDTWVSMGDEREESRRLKAFTGYTIDDKAMAATGKKTTRFLHCLPAHYGHEVTYAVAHGPQSLIFDEAENRLWAQMAVLADLLGLKA